MPRRPTSIVPSSLRAASGASPPRPQSPLRVSETKGRPVRRGDRRRQWPGVEPLEARLALSVVPAALGLGASSPIVAGGSDVQNVSITLPSAGVTNKVDIDLLLDDTGSFQEFAGTVESIFSGLVSSLEAALPGIDFGFGVSRFEDYGGPGNSFSGDLSAARPFILNQPIVTVATAGDAAMRDQLIATALSHTAPGYGGDTPEADIEALDQVATGTGFDGDGNGSDLDSGPAGDPRTQTDPGDSGDVPPFSSNVLPASGTLGGVGWRPDALHLVLLATDTAPVAAFAGGAPIPDTIAGANGVSVPATAFESTAGRVGSVSDAPSTSGNTLPDAVAPVGAATVPATIRALNALGIRVLGMAPGGAPTDSTDATEDPSVFMSALGRLTGALDASGHPLVFSTSVSNADLTDAIVQAIKTTATRPVDIGLSTTALPEGLSFGGSPRVAPGVAPGGTANFTVTFSADHLPIRGSFDVRFEDVGSGAVLGSIPVTVDLPANHPPVFDAAPKAPMIAEPGLPLTFVVQASDPDSGDSVALQAAGLPPGLVLATASAAPGSRPDAQALRATFTPTASQAGQTFVFTFTATDTHGASTPYVVAILVGNPPVFDATPEAPMVVAPGQPLTFDVQASDPDAIDSVSLAASGAPAGLAFAPVPAAPGSRANAVAERASFTPSPDQAGGTYDLTVVATDNHGAVVSKTLVIQVASPPPDATTTPAQPDPAGDGPTVVGLRRLGVHEQPTTLVVAFDAPLDPARAQDPGNYTILGPLAGGRYRARGGVIPVGSAVYDPGARTVALSPVRRLNVHWQYLLSVNGTSPSGLTDASGRFLDGAGTGRPGSSYVGAVNYGSYVGAGRAAADPPAHRTVTLATRRLSAVPRSRPVGYAAVGSSPSLASATAQVAPGPHAVDDVLLAGGLGKVPRRR